MSIAENNLDDAPAVATAPLRIVTASSLFDGHDAAINIMRRIIQQQGAEVIHLGHNRGVDEVVRAAVQENADAIAVSSYQGGHVEYFKYMVDQLQACNAEHIAIFGGGGGTITPDEIQVLQAYGVTRIYHPNDGMQMGLTGMIADLVAHCRRQQRVLTQMPEHLRYDQQGELAAAISLLENGTLSQQDLARYRKQWRLRAGDTPVVGITGTGGAGKSSVTDELLNRFLHYLPDKRIAVLAVDPTRRRSGGALLGDRIRMNSLRDERIYMRSMATRRQHLATSEILGDSILLLQAASFDLVLVETAGIGQSDSEIVDAVDFSIYVMTADYGAASQLEKIDMLDYADMVVLNKYDKRGSEDALRDVRKQWQRNRQAFDCDAARIPVYPSIASQFNDVGMTAIFAHLCRLLTEKLSLDVNHWQSALALSDEKPRKHPLIPDARLRYLAEIAEQAVHCDAHIEQQCAAAASAYHFYCVLQELGDADLPAALQAYSETVLRDARPADIVRLRQQTRCDQ